jgi:16S rRNA (guanine527-N7)-methyltransferase
MDAARIAELLDPFLDAKLAPEQLDQISIYIDLLLRWNARINLTAIREPEQVVTRHFGESLFAASRLLPRNQNAPPPGRVVDVGSGAGFPGLPLKIWSPPTAVTLIESNHKKATFLREVIRALTLTSIDVFPNRAEAYPKAAAGLVTLRAVEKFKSTLRVVAGVLAPKSRLALLIGQPQTAVAKQTLPFLSWAAPIPLPSSQSRVLLVGKQGPSQ